MQMCPTTDASWSRQYLLTAHLEPLYMRYPPLLTTPDDRWTLVATVERRTKKISSLSPTRKQTQPARERQLLPITIDALLGPGWRPDGLLGPARGPPHRPTSENTGATASRRTYGAARSPRSGVRRRATSPAMGSPLAARAARRSSLDDPHYRRRRES